MTTATTPTTRACTCATKGDRPTASPDPYVPVDDLVVGKVFVLLWPRDRFHVLHRPADFADLPERLAERPAADEHAAPRATVRRDAGLYGYERALRRAGMEPIAGVDEAGRGACAGPAGRRRGDPAARARPGEIPGLADSKLLTEKARERCYAQVVRRALAWSVVVIESDECDRLGMHVANVEALRRAVALLDVPPAVRPHRRLPGRRARRARAGGVEGRPGRRLHRAASVLAKVTRDRIMVELDRDYPAYDFKTHKGYVTDVHNAALAEHGPCPEHRMRFVNVRRAAGLEPSVARAVGRRPGRARDRRTWSQH